MASDYSDAPEHIVRHVAAACAGLPEIVQEHAWAGTRWRVRKRTFAHALTVDSPKGAVVVMTFRSSSPELEVLRETGHPFFSPGWGTNVIGMGLADDTDWDEVGELLTESYCLLAPKKLVALVHRPEP